MGKIFFDINHAQNVIDYMREVVEFDVVLVGGDIEELKIPAHRFVLSASSDYFKTMFAPPYRESTASEVKVPHIDGETLKSLVEFCYSGRLEIKADNVEELIVAADSLLWDEVVNVCSSYLTQQLSPRNCLHIIQLAERHNFVSLLKNAKDYCLQNFDQVYSTDEFLNLNVDLLRQLLASDYLCETDFWDFYDQTDLNETEDHIFKSIMTWLKYDPLKREQHKDELLKLVRMPLMKPSYLINSVQPVCTSTVSQQLVAKAMEWHSLPESTKLQVKLAKPRKRINNILMAIIGDSTLKILYHAYRGRRWAEYSWMEWSGKLENRSLFDTAIIDDEIFIVGGCKLNVPLNTIICLNLSTMTVRDVKPMHERRRDVSVAALKGFLYAVGGHDGENCLNTVERYDKETNEWSEVAPMLNRRQKFSVAILNEKLYVVGGCNDSGRLKLAECYDPQQNVWTKMASLGEEAYIGASVTVAGGILYLVGGFHYKVFQMYDPKRDKWVVLGRLLRNRISAPIWTFKDQVMIFDERYFRKYDPIENMWTKNYDMRKLENIHRIFSYSGELEHSEENWAEKYYVTLYDSDSSH